MTRMIISFTKGIFNCMKCKRQFTSLPMLFGHIHRKHSSQENFSVQSVKESSQACPCYSDIFTGNIAAVLMDVINVKTNSNSEQTLPDMLTNRHDSHPPDGTNVENSSP